MKTQKMYCFFLSLFFLLFFSIFMFFLLVLFLFFFPECMFILVASSKKQETTRNANKKQKKHNTFFLFEALCPTRAPVTAPSRAKFGKIRAATGSNGYEGAFNGVGPAKLPPFGRQSRNGPSSRTTKMM